MGRGGLGWVFFIIVVYLFIYFRINNDLFMWEFVDLVFIFEFVVYFSGYSGFLGFWYDNFKMCKLVFKLGRMGILVGVRGFRSWVGLG